MNNAQFIGRLTDDPKQYSGGEGGDRVHFALAVRRPVKGNKADYPEFVAYGNTGDLVMKHLSKGRQVGVEATVQTYKREDEDGVKRQRTLFVAQRLTFIGDRQSDAEPPAGGEEGPEVQF